MSPLKSVLLVNRTLFLDNDPRCNYLLPLTNGITVNEFASEIMRACANYDKSVTWEGAKFLARELLESDTKGVEMPWV
ncbi:hypothetical protein Ngar_c17010 [Candidatus Nitrososphaera gargensis Ga9.2]|uniref:Uncharacterized protein n=1 Tax=Nitrososphaera gargensis (strain Ga9.2) TaxID=1237085 RepID=K0IN25_NITGG|nr:hypothetical protein Ngar_c17010 [Candidatus Nitrososphaera gargensis Ga9.2]